MTSKSSGADDELWTLMSRASDHAISSLEAGGPLIPFSLASSDGERLRLRRYVAGDPEAWSTCGNTVVSGVAVSSGEDSVTTSRSHCGETFRCTPQDRTTLITHFHVAGH